MYHAGRACFLCGRNGTTDPLDKHHIFGGTNRKKSEKYGLTVYLCHHDCHQFGPKAAHQSRETMQALHEYGQRKAMEENGWTAEEFRQIFGRNYLADDALAAGRPEEEGTGFCVLMEGASFPDW